MVSFWLHRLTLTPLPGTLLLVAAPRRFCSETSIVITCCLRAVSELSSWVSASRRGRTGGWIASAKWASTAASRASVLANFPVALAKSRTWRGLTTTTGSASAARAATSASSRPPVASSSTNDGPRVFISETNCGIPASSRGTSHLSPVGRTATSTLAFATSMPT